MMMKHTYIETSMLVRLEKAAVGIEALNTLRKRNVGRLREDALLFKGTEELLEVRLAAMLLGVFLGAVSLFAHEKFGLASEGSCTTSIHACLSTDAAFGGSDSRLNHDKFRLFGVKLLGHEIAHSVILLLMHGAAHGFHELPELPK
jgi:hypothetical protein